MIPNKCPRRSIWTYLLILLLVVLIYFKTDYTGVIEHLFNDSVVNLSISVQSFGVFNGQIVPQYNLTDLFQLPNNANRLVTFDDLASLPEDVWKLAKYPNIYRTYPQDVPITSIVEGIRKGLPVSHMPMYNHPLTLLNITKSVCTGHDGNDLVMVIKSGVLGWQERDAFREFMHSQSLLYPNFKVGHVFSLGLPRKHGGRYFDHNGHRSRLPGHTGELMEKYSKKSNEVMVRIMQEIETYDDIILGNYEDTYFNLTFKTITNLRWISKFCDKQRHDTFMLIDDDHRANFSMLQQFLNQASKADKRNIVFGKINEGFPVVHETKSKWFVPKRDVPWNTYYLYPMGFAQLIGADVVDRMATASAYTKWSGIPDDAYLGMLAFKLNISMRNEPTMYCCSGPAVKAGRRVMVAPKAYFRT